MSELRQNGNLRIFEAPPEWNALYGETLGSLTIFAETSFGVQYCVSEDGSVSILDPEIRHVQPSDLPRAEFLDVIESDPAYYLEQGLYDQCVSRFGMIGLNEHYASIIPIQIGGLQEVENIAVARSSDHMKRLAFLSLQNKDNPPGIQYHPVLSE
jgi:hypothetical protein